MKNDLINGKPVKSIILFALPIMLSSMLQYNYNLVDNIIVGRFVGTDALAAVDAPLIEDGGLAAADPHGLSRAVFDAGGTAPTALILQDDRVLHH